MKLYKQIDLYGSILIALVAFLFLFLDTMYSFFTCYFVLGSWQFISIVAHFINKQYCKKNNTRVGYQFLVFIIVIITLVGLLVTEILWFIAIVMFLLAPFMALFYMRMCYKEIYTSEIFINDESENN